MNTDSLFLSAVVCAAGGCLLPASGQSTISPTDRYAYAANAGWLDFRPAAGDGVRVTDTALTGYSHAANFGWIHFGNGTPANGHTYTNTSATDYGVNLSPAGLLTGFAYAANVGWIHFEQAEGQPMLNLSTGKFTGSAYCANLGWIALDTAFSDLATATISRPDTDGDGMADAWERLHFGSLTTANATSDRDGDCASDLAEYNAGTLPLDASSRLRIVAHFHASDRTQATIQFTSVGTRSYRIEYDNDLLGAWTNSALGTFAPAGFAATTTVSLTGLTAVPRRYFRAVAVPLPTAP